MPIDLAKLLRNEDIGDALGFLCELEAEGDPRDITIIARDGSGGVFVTVPTSPRIMYASSEGEAGVIASDIDEFITLIVACPYWRDLLRYSGGGKLDEMRRAQGVLEAS